MIRKGDIYWARVLDEQGNLREIVHPQLVIQDTIINGSRIESIVVCGISTNMKKAHEPGNILLDSQEANLPKRSIIVVSEISHALKKDFGTFIGSLSEERMNQVFSGMKFIQSFEKR